MKMSRSTLYVFPADTCRQRGAAQGVGRLTKDFMRKDCVGVYDVIRMPEIKPTAFRAGGIRPWRQKALIKSCLASFGWHPGNPVWKIPDAREQIDFQK